MTDGLKDKHRKAIIDVLSANERVERVVLFGSRAMGTFTPTSDVDIVLFGDKLTPTDQSKLAEAIDGLSVPQQVDILLHKSIRKKELLKHIKQHGMEWWWRSGAMVNEWRESTWGEEISLEYGKGLRGYADATGTVRVFGTNGPVGWTTEPLAPGPGIIVGRKGAYRGVHYSPDPFFVIDTAYYVKPKSDLDMRWLYYAIIHHKLGEINDGSPIPSTTRAAVYVRKLKVPSPDEQRDIAEILGSLDDKIELNRRMNRILEAMARALFKSWFVDFDPVRTKAAGQDTGLPGEIAALFPDAFEESELGKIPEGWEVKPLGEVLDITMGQSPPSEFYNERGEGLPFHQGVRDYGYRFPEHRVCCTLEARIAEAGDVLLSVRAPVGRINVADRRMVIGRGLAAARHPDGHSSYALYSLKHLFAEEDAVGDGTVYKAITKKFLLAMPVVYPPDELISEAEKLLKPLDSLLGNSEQESRVIASIRDALLPRLLSGEIRIRDAEKFVERIT